jgi:hypothetical protein
VAKILDASGRSEKLSHAFRHRRRVREAETQLRVLLLVCIVLFWEICGLRRRKLRPPSRALGTAGAETAFTPQQTIGSTTTFVQLFNVNFVYSRVTRIRMNDGMHMTQHIPFLPTSDENTPIVAPIRPHGNSDIKLAFHLHSSRRATRHQSHILNLLFCSTLPTTGG